MAANDFTDIVSRGLYLARRVTSNAHALARGGELANEWHQSVCDSGHDWTFLKREITQAQPAGDATFTTADLENSGSLSAGQLREVLAVTDVTNSTKPLKRLEWSELEAMARSTQDGDPRGTPLYYTRLNTTFRLWPTPDEAVNLFLVARIQSTTLSGTQAFLTPVGWTARLAIPYIAIRLLQMDGSRDALSLSDRLQVQYDKDFDDFVGVWASPDEDITFKSPSLTDDLDLIDYDAGFSE